MTVPDPHDEKKSVRTAQVQDAIPGLLAMLSGKKRVELENFSMEIGDLELWIPTGTAPPGGITGPGTRETHDPFYRDICPAKRRVRGPYP